MLPGNRDGAYNVKWVTVQEQVEITANQHPDGYLYEMFEGWVLKGWEIVSITVFPPITKSYMCRAVGVLRLPDPTSPVKEP